MQDNIAIRIRKCTWGFRFALDQTQDPRARLPLGRDQFYEVGNVSVAVKSILQKLETKRSFLYPSLLRLRARDHH